MKEKKGEPKVVKCHLCGKEISIKEASPWPITHRANVRGLYACGTCYLRDAF
jgi:hypothetical protein